MRDTIATYRARGWATIRVQPLGKAPITDTVSWRDRTDEADTFAPGDNVGIRLGEPSGGLVDIDLDSLEAVALAHHFLPPTATFGRASKLRSHWVYQCATPPKTRKHSSSHIELRSTGAQTVFPPSIHETGEPIAWSDATPITALDEAALVQAFGRLAAATTIARAWPRLTGNRHDTVLALAGCLWHEGWTLDDALGLLIPAMELDGTSEPHREAAIRDTWDEHDRNRHGWPTLAHLLGPVDAKGVQRAVELVATSPRSLADPSGRPLSDLGNAERLADEHGQDLRYVPGLKWIQWDGARWQPLGGDPIELAARSARALQRVGTETGQVALSKWGFASESASRLAATVKLAKDLSSLRGRAEDLDADPWVLCCPNGIVDLRTGALREHSRDDLITKLTGAAYHPHATAPRFVSFLREIFENDDDLAAYVLRFLGYSLTGATSEQIFQVWHGHGSNGKSVLVDTIRHVLGDYAQILASDLLIERRQGRSSESASPDVARLRGARFAAGVETKEGQRWNESLVKQLTGSDRVVARHLHSELIEFDPTWKIVLAVNHKPIVRGTDRGMWRRIHLVPFDATFDGPRADRTLPDTLRREADGILALLVRACLMWQKHGLAPPARVAAEVESYRAGQDVVGSFIDEVCVLGQAQRANKAKLYQAYRHWCSNAGEYTHGKHAFNNHMRERGFEDERISGTVHWVGIGIDSSTLGVKL